MSISRARLIGKKKQKKKKKTVNKGEKYNPEAGFEL